MSNISPGSNNQPGPPELFVSGVLGGICAFDISADGKSIIAVEGLREPTMIVVQNWFEELERLLPTK